MTMKDYVIRRVIVIVPTFFLITLMVFTLIHLAPGDPTNAMGGPHPLKPETRERIRIEYGLDQPIPIQYLMWLNKLLHGDLGFSYLNQAPVVQMISLRIPNTLELAFLSEFFSIVIAVVLGVIAAVKHHSIYDASFSVAALAGYSIPDFWLGLMLMLVFSVWLGWFPVSSEATYGIAFATPFHALLDNLWHFFIPVLTLVAVWTAYLFRLVRSAMLEVLMQDYVTTARSKGLKERVVIYKHALRNALLPVVTYVGNSIGFLFSGAAVIESIFSLPGLGELMVKSSEARDYPALMGLGIAIALMVLVANLCTDISYAVIDPRIRYD
jgi:ABC-type dipeptide/oligopeptide/nickel transport system permease component